MAGRLDGFADGRPVSLLADGRDLVLVTREVGTLLRLRPWWRVMGGPLRTVLRAANLRLLVRVACLGRLEVHPNPSLLVKLLLPLNR